jgi:methionine aminotransferase
MRSIDSKLPDVGTTIFTIMTRLAEHHDALNLSQGFPDFQPPSRLVELVSRALTEGHNQYAPPFGLPALGEALARKLVRCYGVEIDPQSMLTVTPGATAALFAAVQAIVRSGDEVILLDPAYDSYAPAVTLAGGQAVHVALDGQTFDVDWVALEGALSNKTRLVIINSPHNPSGALLDGTAYDRFAELLRPYDCYLLSDEVYEHVVFDGSSHATVLAHAELAERSLAVFSFGKTYHATGWKLGYCVGPPYLTDEFRRVHQFMVFATNRPIQHALAQFLDESPEHDETLPSFYQEKRDTFVEALGASGFACTPAHGTYFQLVDYSAISTLDDVSFARWLTEKHRVAAIPVSVFYEQPPDDLRLLRFCFAKETETLRLAAERLCSV